MPKDAGRMRSDLIEFTVDESAIDPISAKGTGSLLLSSKALPLGNLFDPSLPEGDIFLFDYLRRLLAFCELVVVYEQLLACRAGQYEVSKSVWDSPPFKKDISHEDMWVKVGEARDVNKKLLKRLRANNILQESSIRGAKESPIESVERHLQHNPRLQHAYNTKWQEYSEEEQDETILHNLVVAKLAHDFGEAIYLADAFGSSNTPYLLARAEETAVGDSEALEELARKSAMAYLKQHLDMGAQAELKRLEEVGFSTVFPRTPIAMQIFLESTSLDDIPNVTLELRDHYRAFRQEMAELDRSLMDEDRTLKQKIKLTRRLDVMADELWKNQPGLFHKSAIEMTKLADSISVFSPAQVPKLVTQLLMEPVEILFRALRQRRVRVMLKSKGRFLESKTNTRKVAKLLDKSPEMVEKWMQAVDQAAL